MKYSAKDSEQFLFQIFFSFPGIFILETGDYETNKQQVNERILLLFKMDKMMNLIIIYFVYKFQFH